MADKYIEVFPQFEEVTGFFSTKEGATEGYPYDREDVFEENWLEEAMPVWPKQVHGDHIEIIEQRPYRPVELEDTDGLITNLRGVLLTTLHADCIPVYLFDYMRNVVGLVHAGWKGTAKGIAAKAVYMMNREYGCDPENIMAFIGPGISKCCFETGDDVYEAFDKGSYSFDIFEEKWDFIDDFAEKKGDKYYIDLKGINKKMLMDIGIPEENIEISEHCTCCEPEMFDSYRREGGTYMRMGAGICLI